MIPVTFLLTHTHCYSQVLLFYSIDFYAIRPTIYLRQIRLPGASVGLFNTYTFPDNIIAAKQKNKISLLVSNVPNNSACRLSHTMTKLAHT